MHCSPRILHFCLLIHSFLVNLPSYLLGTVMAPWKYCKRYIDMLKYCLLYKTWLMTELTQVRRFLYKKNSLGNGRIPSMMLGIAFSMIFKHFQLRRCCMSLHVFRFDDVCKDLQLMIVILFHFQSMCRAPAWNSDRGGAQTWIWWNVWNPETGVSSQCLKPRTEACSTGCYSQGWGSASTSFACAGTMFIHVQFVVEPISGRHFPSQPLNWPCMKHHWVFSIL